MSFFSLLHQKIVTTFAKNRPDIHESIEITAAIFYHKTILIDMHHQQEYEERIESKIHLY